jgi:hypothetical protein
MPQIWVSRTYNSYKYPVPSGSVVEATTIHSQDYDHTYDPTPSGHWPPDIPAASGVVWDENEHEHTVELDGREVTAVYPRKGASTLDQDNVTKTYRKDI